MSENIIYRWRHLSETRVCLLSRGDPTRRRSCPPDLPERRTSLQNLWSDLRGMKLRIHLLMSLDFVMLHTINCSKEQFVLSGCENKLTEWDITDITMVT